MPGPRTAQTLKLEPTRRQFFQWYFIERMTITEVKERMDTLSKELDRSAGEDFIASVSEWEGRRRYWNSQRDTKWNIKDKERGNLSLVVPDDIAHLSLWWKGTEVVGNWRNFPQHDYDRSYFPSTSNSVKDIRHENAINQMSHNSRCGQVYDWGLAQGSDSGDASRKPSMSSASSNSSYTFMPEYEASANHSTTSTEDDSLQQSYREPNTRIHLPKVSHYKDNIHLQSFADHSISTQQAMEAPAMSGPYLGPGYTPFHSVRASLSEPAVPYIGLQGNYPSVPMRLPHPDQPAHQYQSQYQDIHHPESSNLYRHIGTGPALSSVTPLLEHQAQRFQSYPR